MTPPRLYTFPEAADVLRCSWKTVARHVDAGEIQVVNIATTARGTGLRPTWRIREEDLIAFIDQRSTA